MELMEFYGQGPGPVNINRKAIDMVRSFIKWSTFPESIIDVGVGDGKVTKTVIFPILPDNIKEYVGADLSIQALNFSKTTVDHPKYKTWQIDICSKDLPVHYRNRFDKVFACFLLHMIGPEVR